MKHCFWNEATLLAEPISQLYYWMLAPVWLVSLLNPSLKACSSGKSGGWLNGGLSFCTAGARFPDCVSLGSDLGVASALGFVPKAQRART